MEAIVEYNYVAQEPDELTLRKGDIIKEIKVMFGGWWEGTLRDKRGMFPDNFVKVLEPATGTMAGSTSEGSTKCEEVPLRNGSGRRFCKVIFSYEPCNEDELTLVPNDSIEYLGEVEEGWWRGRLRGRIGVFPSNFVSPPVYEESEKHKDKDRKELCRVLFPYEAANDDELTLVEGDVITLLSRDAPDKGWWKGELRGQIGLFPDNFVEVISMKNDAQDQEQWHETSQTTTKSIAKHSHQAKKTEKAHIRKSLDVRNVHTESTKKVSASSSSSSTSPLSCLTGGIGERGSGGSGGSGGGTDKKSSGNHSIISSLKRLVGDVGSNNGNGTTNVALGEELDGVERGEGAPLSHLTASRAKAPRRRPPSSQHLRHHAAGSSAITSATPTALTGVNNTILEDTLANGTAETGIEQLREDEGDGLVAKARKLAPWVEELKMNQMERRKISSSDRVDKSEVKKERNYSRLTTSTSNVADFVSKTEGDTDNDKYKEKEKNQRVDTGHDQIETPAYVPYHLYNQLLERVATLEEKQIRLQQTVGQLSDQLVSLLVNTSVNNKV